MRLRVCFKGLEPIRTPGPEEEGGYTIEAEPGSALRDLLDLFGLEEPGLAFVKDGQAVTADYLPAQGEEITILLMAVGG